MDINNFVVYEDFEEHGINKSECIEQVGITWTLMFNGYCSNLGNGVWVVLVSPKQEIFNFSFKLKFECINNIVKYEALVLGLRIAWR